MISVYFNHALPNTIMILMIIIHLIDSFPDYNMPRENDVAYHTYFERNIDRFNQIKLSPEDFYLSVHNPYYLRLPRPNTSYQDYEKQIDLEMLVDKYEEDGRSLLHKFSLKVTDKDLKRNLFADKDLNFKPEIKYYEVNMKLIELEARRLCYKSFTSVRLSDFVRNIKFTKKTLDSHDSVAVLFNMNEKIPPLEIFEPNMDSQVQIDHLLHIPSEDNFTYMQKILDLLPKENTTPEEYTPNQVELAKYIDALEDIFKDDSSPIQLNQEIMESFKLPFRLKNENYNFYVLRMINLGLIPLHREMFTREPST